LSDSISNGTQQDTSCKSIVEHLKNFKLQVLSYKVLPDDRMLIENELKNLADGQKIDLIITTGGTGIGPRDVTPQATIAVVERRLDGVEEMLRSFGQNRLPTAMLTRGIVGVRGNTLIINLPGSRSGVEDGIDAIFPQILHTFKMMKGERH